MTEKFHSPSKTARSVPLKVSLLVATVCVDVLVGFIAWQLVRPGESLLWPTALVALIMAAPVIVWSRVIKSIGGWRSCRSLSASVVGLCIVPILWSYFGVLPASVTWDSTATGAISAAIDGGGDGCHVVSYGSVGLLDAPYTVCISRNDGNYIVRFSTVDLKRGYAYVVGKSDLNWFPDQCARQLLSHWWAFYSNSIQTVNCPFGYAAHGGG